MSDQPKSATPRKRAARPRPAAVETPAVTETVAAEAPPASVAVEAIDPAASAALEQAVTSALKAANPLPEAAPEPANENRPRLRVVGALALALAAGLAGGFALQPRGDETARMAAELRDLKSTVAGLESAVRGARTEAELRQAALAERLDRLPQDTSFARVTDGLERIEASLRDMPRPAERVAATAAPKPAAPAAPAPEAPTETGGVTVAVKDTPVDGWVLHEVYDGIALIEGKNRRLLEVAPGETVPGIGRVEAIEKRGKRWVVVTGKGVIAPTR